MTRVLTGIAGAALVAFAMAQDPSYGGVTLLWIPGVLLFLAACYTPSKEDR
jgi:hypothetical protein